MHTGGSPASGTLTGRNSATGSQQAGIAGQVNSGMIVCDDPLLLKALYKHVMLMYVADPEKLSIFISEYFSATDPRSKTPLACFDANFKSSTCQHMGPSGCPVPPNCIPHTLVPYLRMMTAKRVKDPCSKADDGVKVCTDAFTYWDCTQSSFEHFPDGDLSCMRSHNGCGSFRDKRGLLREYPSVGCVAANSCNSNRGGDGDGGDDDYRLGG